MHISGVTQTVPRGGHNQPKSGGKWKARMNNVRLCKGSLAMFLGTFSKCMKIILPTFRLICYTRTELLSYWPKINPPYGFPSSSSRSQSIYTTRPDTLVPPTQWYWSDTGTRAHPPEGIYLSNVINTWSKPTVILTFGPLPTSHLTTSLK